jgi:hypothetical protein
MACRTWLKASNLRLVPCFARLALLFVALSIMTTERVGAQEFPPRGEGDIVVVCPDPLPILTPGTGPSTTNVTPEPGSIVLFGMGASWLLLSTRGHRRNSA